MLPGQPNLSRESPGGGVAPQRAEPADVFYVTPTTFASTGTWNQDIGDYRTNAWTDVSVVARHVTIFNTCCRIYVPRYRQASTGSSLTKGSSGAKAYDLAYQDVKAAFEYYLAHYNHGRPFILAGHSQGALHVYHLLKDEIDGKPLQSKLVAAYAIGVPTYAGAFGREYASIKPCLKPSQTGCIVSWNSFVADADPSNFLKLSKELYHTYYGTTVGDDVFCINPLTFDADRPAAPASANGGSLAWPPMAGALAPLSPHAVSAVCRDGALMVTVAPGSAFKPYTLPGGSTHYQDTDLFYDAMQRNGLLRVKSYIAR